MTLEEGRGRWRRGRRSSSCGRLHKERSPTSAHCSWFGWHLRPGMWRQGGLGNLGGNCDCVNVGIVHQASRHLHRLHPRKAQRQGGGHPKLMKIKNLDLHILFKHSLFLYMLFNKKVRGEDEECQAFSTRCKLSKRVL